VQSDSQKAKKIKHLLIIEIYYLKKKTDNNKHASNRKERRKTNQKYNSHVPTLTVWPGSSHRLAQ